MIDPQRGGNRVGGGGVANEFLENVDRRERLRRLAMETIDLNKDPYFFRNNIGTYECRLCLTIHINEASYLAHTQGKKHQTNLNKRLLIEQKNLEKKNEFEIENQVEYKNFIKIGQPGYKVTKMKNELGKNILFEIYYPNIEKDVVPRYRLMSSFEQRVEIPDEKYQYIIFAAEPYESIAFKIPNKEVDNSEDKYLCTWDEDNKTYTVQIYFK
jgi:splicing factor 3A subunit 2